jgi:SAM-dependent methyltransferase
MSGPFQRYLLAKRTVDDRALNRHVYDLLADHPLLHSLPLRVLEVGCGIGTMAERVVQWGLFDAADGVRYLGVDSDAASVEVARHRTAHLTSLRPTFAVGDLHAVVAQQSGACDLIIAHAVLDLLHLPTALPLLRAALKPGGLGWFTINFDGATLLEPQVDAMLDARIEAAYHATMDARTIDGHPSGDSRTGRHLFAALPAAGLQILAAGASDWVVHPLAGAWGATYPDDEAFFLRFIIETMGGALAGRTDLDQQALTEWVERRLRQVDAAELTYIAHQLDFLVQRPTEDQGTTS